MSLKLLQFPFHNFNFPHLRLTRSRGECEGVIFASVLTRSRGECEGVIFASVLTRFRGECRGVIFASVLLTLKLFIHQVCFYFNIASRGVNYGTISFLCTDGLALMVRLWKSDSSKASYVAQNVC